MPVTINSPNFWDLQLDNFINKSERRPNSDGSYSFITPQDEESRATSPYKPGSNLLPNPKYDSGDPKVDYNNNMRIMEAETEAGGIPYNSERIGTSNPDLLDAIKNWIAGGGSRRVR